jgi:hypothetical protein
VAEKAKGLAREYQGRSCRIVHCQGAFDSYREALRRVNARRAGSLTRNMIAQIKRLADGDPMSQGTFRKEGPLPNQPGQQGTKHFWALKKIPLRGYGWYSTLRPKTFYISHYIYKDQDGLADRDSKRVGRNWRRIEENGDEH